jgi:integrase
MPTPAAKITFKTIDAARKARDRDARLGTPYRAILRDAAVRGLSLEVGATAMVWRFSYRPKGLTPEGKRQSARSIHLGDASAMHPDDARRAAAEAKDLVRDHRDPAEERRAEVARATAEERARRSCGDLLDGFARWAADRSGPRGKVGAKYVHDLNREARVALEALDALSLAPADISPRQIGAALGKGKRGAAAMLRMNALRLFFDYCTASGAVDDNPCARLGRDERPKKGRERQRVLEPEEVRAIWDAAGSLKPIPRDLIRFMLCVPARGIEVTGMRWQDVRGGHWHQDATATKNGEAHRFALHLIAVEILDARAEAMGGREPGALIFSGRTGKPVARNSIKASIDGRLGADFPEWTLHDCRRTFASLLARSGCRLPESAIDGALNHKASATRGGIVGTYMAEPRRGEQDEALRLWGALLGEILGRSAGGNVVRMERAS